MTRLNLGTIACVGVVSLLCYQQVNHDPYGRYFADALDTIHRQALQRIDRQPLFDAAVEGMTSLLDQHSTFIPRDKKQAYESELDQHFTGIGIELQPHDKKTGRIVVANTIVGNPRPAHEAGMKAGDQIVAINGQAIGQMPLEKALNLIRGRAGTKVHLTVLHEGAKEPVDMDVTRQEIQVDSVVGDVREDDGSWHYLLPTKPPIAYVRIKAFGQGTAAQLRQVLEKLQEQGNLHALTVDVRDNPGGYLEEADEVCDLFIASGTIVSTKGRSNDRTGAARNKVWKASGKGPFQKIPMAVLINQESASASEIFAACMQDHHRAAIVGERSFGKGSVQVNFPMEAGHSTLKLTTATYWRPSEKNIHREAGAKDSDDWGVRPDSKFNVALNKTEESDRREKRQSRDAFRPGSAAKPREPMDPQLAKAVEDLQAKLAAESAKGSK